MSLRKKDKEDFWLDNYKELFWKGKYIKFYPTYEMSRLEQLNALTRFFIYLIILLIIFKKNENWFYLPITGIILIVVLFNINRDDILGKHKELMRVLNRRSDEIDEKREVLEKIYEHDGDKKVQLDIDNEKSEIEDEDKGYDLESGHVDGDGDIRIGKKLGVGRYKRDRDPSLYSIDEIIDFQKNTCRRPTQQNPFMNPDVTEFNSGDPPAACNADDDDIHDEIKVNFNHNLFQDVDELYERVNSQRQFYTLPNTAIPNNQIEFAKWLYKLPNYATCKEDQNACLRYEDLRFRRL